MENAENIPETVDETLSSLNLSVFFQRNRSASSLDDSQAKIPLPSMQSGQPDVSISQRSRCSEDSFRHENSQMVIDHTLAAADRSFHASHRNETVGDLDESQWSSVSSSTRLSAANPLSSQSKVLRDTIRYNAARNLVPGIRSWNSPPDACATFDDSVYLDYPSIPSHAPVAQMVPDLRNVNLSERKDRPISAECRGAAAYSPFDYCPRGLEGLSCPSHGDDGAARPTTQDTKLPESGLIESEVDRNPSSRLEPMLEQTEEPRRPAQLGARPKTNLQHNAPKQTIPPPPGLSKPPLHSQTPLAMKWASGPGGGDHLPAPSRPTTFHPTDQHRKGPMPSANSTVDMEDLMQRHEDLKKTRTTSLGPDMNLPGTGNAQRRTASGADAETPHNSNPGPSANSRSEAIEELRAKAKALLSSAATFIKHSVNPQTRNLPFKQLIELCQTRISKFEELMSQTLRYNELRDESHEISRAIDILSAIIIEVGLKNTVQPPRAAATGPPPMHDHSNDTPDNSTKLYGLKSQLVSLVRRMAKHNLPDIDQHSQRVAGIKDLFDHHVSDIRKAIQDANTILDRYTNLKGHETDLAQAAYDTINIASEWCEEVVSRYQQERAHLAPNAKVAEFKTRFKVGGTMSIYEHLRKFEDHADQQLPPGMWAQQLYHRNLDGAILTTYPAIERYENDYPALKHWLINRFGDLQMIFNDAVKAITALKIPKAGDTEGEMDHSRSIFGILSGLTKLEISKGTPVPGLDTHLGDNRFLTTVVSILPEYVQMQFFERQAAEELINSSSVVGRKYLDIINGLLWKRFTTLEVAKGFNGSSADPNKTTTQSRKGKTNDAKQTTTPVSTHTVTQPTPPPPSVPVPQPPAPQRSYIPTAPNSGNQSNGNSPHPRKFTQVVYTPWTCPLRDHDDHALITCGQFFEMTPAERRLNTRACFTCLDKNRQCFRGACGRIETVPAELICADCAKFARPGSSPPHIMYCGRQNHKKLSVEELTLSMEAWVPDLVIKDLTKSLCTHLTFFNTHNACAKSPNPKSIIDSLQTTRTKIDPVNKLKDVVFDTSTGAHRPLGKDDRIIEQSGEAAFYTLQTLKLGDCEVLTFFDSGSSGNIIEGELAERLKLQVLTDSGVDMGGFGGIRVWSEYGCYLLALGPSTDNKIYSLEVQGVDTITERIPRVDLRRLWPEAKTLLGNSTTLPTVIGGSRVNLLIGIKSTPLEPVRLHTLPNGLGIFRSVFKDVHGSDIIFGGPHAIFSEAYSRLGKNVNHIQILLTELASSYRRSPVTFVRADLDDHGPEDCKREWKDKSCPLDPETGEDTLLAESTLCENACFKSLVPLSKLKGLQDELDIPDMGEFKCDSCAQCKTCKMSSRAKTKSLQETFEQDVIEKSVRIDLEAQKVFVSLPFIRDPVDFLTKKHGGKSNKMQALRIYQAQCRKPEQVKAQVRVAINDLVNQGFMVKLSSLPTDVRQDIANAPVYHFYPWRAVYKLDSVTTPVRVVVNPTITGLNEILAKGTNMLLSIPEILTRFRSHMHAWNTDVSKLYNRLFLEPKFYPLSLFLYSESLDPNATPDTYVMLRAWYGVSSTGNQASVAIEQLATQFKDAFPLAHDLLTKARYVDDILGGADSDEIRERQIEETEKCLAKGGLSLKYVARSGQPPPLKASTDGVHVGCLGLRWNTLADTLAPGYDSSFYPKKVKGQAAKNNVDLSKDDNLEKALEDGSMTRVGVLSRVAEFYDPCGFWEPLKIQMKLTLHNLNKLDWSDPVPPEDHKTWIRLFKLMDQTRSDKLPRCFKPASSHPLDDTRLICLADASAEAAGAAIYAGVPQPGGNYSCQLVMSKSKLMKGTVPRNELEGILLTAEVSQTVSAALSTPTEATLLFSDSNIAICWVLNGRKRLRAWVFNRVNAILSLLHVRAGSGGVVPLFHIPGPHNLADLVTKTRCISLSDYDCASEWQVGLPWMTSSTDSLPKDQPVSVEASASTDYNKEIFQEVEINMIDDRQILLSAPPPIAIHALAPARGLPKNWLLTIVDFKYLGWHRARRRVIGVVRAKWAFLHLIHKRHSRRYRLCCYCRDSDSPLLEEADKHIYAAASFQAEKFMGARYLRTKFFKEGDIWYSAYRLEKEDPVETIDLEKLPFVDSTVIKKVLPIVLVQSEIFSSLLAHVHYREMPHSGVENTLKRILERMHPVGSARHRIRNFKAACSKCRILLKRTVNSELADFISARTCIAPPFWHAQIDIAMGFKGRETEDSVRVFPCYALVICCLLTSATSILALPNLTTAGVVMALERHASRYGLPGKLFVDCGRQLEKLKDCQFSFTDVLRHFNDDQQFEIVSSAPKAHHQHGRVEKKVHALRTMLEKLSLTEDKSNTLLGWETVFAKIADQVDNLPIARGSASAASDLGWEIITPNRLKLGRNSFRQLEGDIVLTNSPQSMLERNQLISATWYQIFIDRLHLLIPPPQHAEDRLPRIGDVCLFVHEDPNYKRLWTWRLGIIQAQMSRTTFEIRYCTPGTGRVRTLVRATRQISVIVPEESN